MTSQRVRAVVLAACGLLLWLSAPLLLLLRVFFQTPRWFGKVSIWTGAPIITIPLKCKAERLLGWNARSVVRDTYHLTSAFDFVVSSFGRHQVLQLAFSHLAAIGIALFARQVHSFVDGGLLPSLERRCYNPFELYLYRFLGIRQFFWTYGGDVRTRERTLALGTYNACIECPAVMQACVCSQAVLDGNLRRIQSVAAAVFTMGDMTEYVPGSITDLFYWPIAAVPVLNGRDSSAKPFTSSRPMRVVHAANHRFFKGTERLVQVVQDLKAEGLPVDLTLVEGLDNATALQIYQSADVIFDQCLIGFHGYFALEAMALGKPVLCFVRDRERYLLNPDECPIINTHPDTLADDLRRLLTAGGGELRRIGTQGQAYVLRHYSVEAFSARLGSFYSTLH